MSKAPLPGSVSPLPVSEKPPLPELTGAGAANAGRVWRLVLGLAVAVLPLLGVCFSLCIMLKSVAGLNLRRVVILAVTLLCFGAFTAFKVREALLRFARDRKEHEGG